MGSGRVHVSEAPRLEAYLNRLMQLLLTEIHLSLIQWVTSRKDLDKSGEVSTAQMTISRDAETKSEFVILLFPKIDLCRFCDLQRPQGPSVGQLTRFFAQSG